MTSDNTSMKQIIGGSLLVAGTFTGMAASVPLGGATFMLAAAAAGSLVIAGVMIDDLTGGPERRALPPFAACAPHRGQLPITRRYQPVDTATPEPLPVRKTKPITRSVAPVEQPIAVPDWPVRQPFNIDKQVPK